MQVTSRKLGGQTSRILSLRSNCDFPLDSGLELRDPSGREKSGRSIPFTFEFLLNNYLPAKSQTWSSENDGLYCRSEPCLPLSNDREEEGGSFGCRRGGWGMGGKGVDDRMRTRKRGFWVSGKVVKRVVELDLQSDALCLCVGDFSEILYQYEKTEAHRPQWQINYFGGALERSDLCGLGYRGPLYTWCNRPATPDTVWAQLDRACGNSGCCVQFQDTTVNHKPVPYLNHSMLVICLDSEGGTWRTWRKPQFMFKA
ncbi:UNVERIFIED_CONTAM: hypothetical protein Slati_0135900 [Sesamum latifolium]|uniref:Uncharacterized protein n=1 Tax=Sesamum latifolium TaxID=2727402 RepID=A0AAW2Y9N0_9LAMI